MGHLQRPQPRRARGIRRQGDRVRLRARGRLPAVRARFRAGADPVLEPVRDPVEGDMATRPLRCWSLRRSWSSLVGWPANQPGHWEGWAWLGRPARLPATCWRLRTPTAGSARRRARPPRSCTPAGSRSDWPRPATNPADVSRDGHNLLDYIQTGVSSGTDPGSIERTILVMRAARALGGELRRAQPPRRARTRDPPERVGVQSGQPDRVRGARVPGGGGSAAAGHARMDGPSAGLGRRLQLRDPGWLERRRRHRCGARGARRGGWSGGRACPGAGDPVSAPPAGRRRGLSGHAGRRVERPVDRVRGAGAGSGRRRPELAAPPGRLAARLPARADRAGRPRPLLALGRSDPDLGHRRGAARARRQAASALARGAPVRAAPTPRGAARDHSPPRRGHGRKPRPAPRTPASPRGHAAPDAAPVIRRWTSTDSLPTQES